MSNKIQLIGTVADDGTYTIKITEALLENIVGGMFKIISGHKISPVNSTEGYAVPRYELEVKRI